MKPCTQGSTSIRLCLVYSDCIFVV
uniref:Uncharacterized protein n=1 Tax=Arabidopsis thaliana TaxID=3702 RepID=Q56YV0_ARATH|nr:hypothetical protein [Arabidopsis thaliana]